MTKYQTEFKLETVKRFFLDTAERRCLRGSGNTWGEDLRLEEPPLHARHWRVAFLQPSNSYEASRWRPSITSAIPTKWWSGDASSIKTACGS